MKARNIIWTSEVSLSDWDASYAAQYPKVKTDEQKEQILSDISYENFCDAQNELRKTVDGIIVAFAFVQTWNNKSIVIVPLNNTLSSVLETGTTGVHVGEFTWYVDNRKNLWCEARHHDGVNRILYRYIPNSGNINNRIAKLKAENQCRRLTQEKIMRSTKSAGALVCQIYGWI